MKGLRCATLLVPGLALFAQIEILPTPARSQLGGRHQSLYRADGRIDPARCTICHPGATAGLRQSIHANLLSAPATRAQACTVCHGDLTAHADAQKRPENKQIQPTPVAKASCATCHAEQDYATALGAHAWHRPLDLSQLEKRGQKPEDWPVIDKTGLATFNWGGLIQAGYRFVSTRGSYERYQTDIDLEPGLRLHSFELEGNGDAAYLDSFRAEAHDVGDPYSTYRLDFGRDDLYRGRAAYRRSIYTYRATGDYHRVDRKTKSANFDLSFDVTDDVSVFGAYTNHRENGFWLTNRIGNQNLTPIGTIDGVQSPRELRGDDFELGISGDLGGLTYTIAAEYRDERSTEAWTFSRPAIANPAFTEAEDFVSLSDIDGPGVRFALARAFDAVDIDISGRYHDLDRRIEADGTGSGYDISDFTSTTTSSSTGNAQTFVLDGTVSWELADTVVLLADLRWRDHSERMRIDRTDTTVYPTLSTTTTVTTGRDQFTSQEVFDGALEVEFEPVESLILSAGYGFSREELEVPDLESGDNDFRSGTADNRGVLAGIDYRPTAHWTFIGRYSDYGQTGLQLHDLTMRDARTADGRVRFIQDAFRTEVFARNRHAENPVSYYRFDSTTYGLTTSWTEPDELNLFGSYTITDTDSRTLTNFYFDPDPTPAATVVGFDGETQTVLLGFDLQLSNRVNWRGDFSWSKTRGDFDLRVRDFRTDLTVRVFDRGSAGVEYRQIDYREQSGLDDYRADLVMLYWRQPF